MTGGAFGGMAGQMQNQMRDQMQRMSGMMGGRNDGNDGKGRNECRAATQGEGCAKARIEPRSAVRGRRPRSRPRAHRCSIPILTSSRYGLRTSPLLHASAGRAGGRAQPGRNRGCAGRGGSPATPAGPAAAAKVHRLKARPNRPADPSRSQTAPAEGRRRQGDGAGQAAASSDAGKTARKPAPKAGATKTQPDGATPKP